MDALILLLERRDDRRLDRWRTLAQLTQVRQEFLCALGQLPPNQHGNPTIPGCEAAATRVLRSPAHLLLANQAWHSEVKAGPRTASGAECWITYDNFERPKWLLKSN